jgi:hypothetical protein
MLVHGVLNVRIARAIAFVSPRRTGEVQPEDCGTPGEGYSFRESLRRAGMNK